jgi:hypothetical protein
MSKVLSTLAAISTGLLLSQSSNAQDGGSFYDGTKLTGDWNMTAVADLTSCTTVYSGDKESAKWELTFSSGAIQIKSSSGATLSAEEPYRESSKEKFTMYAHYTGKSSSISGIYELKMADKAGKTFKGRRIHYVQAPSKTENCVMLHNVTLTKL